MRIGTSIITNTSEGKQKTVKKPIGQHFEKTLLDGLRDRCVQGADEEG